MIRKPEKEFYHDYLKVKEKVHLTEKVSPKEEEEENLWMNAEYQLCIIKQERMKQEEDFWMTEK